MLISGILLLTGSCVQPQNTIRVEINENDQFFVDGKEVSRTDFKQVLSERENELIQQGYDADKISVETKVNANATVKSLSHLNTTLRELNVKKIDVK